MAPKLDPSELPVGPDTEAAAPSPAMVEQKTVIEHNDLPKAVPTETDDPDRVVSPNETKKPEEEPKMQTVQAQPSTASIAAEATAPPTLQERAGSAAFGCSLARNRRERTARQSDLAKGTRRPLQ